MMIIRTAFSSGDVDRDRQLLEGIDQVIDEVRVSAPGQRWASPAMWWYRSPSTTRS